MKNVNGVNIGEFNGEASKWGLTDLYEDASAELQKLLNAEGDFDTGWLDCKKECRTARYTRVGDKIRIEVSECIDSLWESDALIYDALWDVAKTEDELPEDIIESIREAALDSRIEDALTLSREYSAAGMTLTKLISITGALECKVSEKLHIGYLLLREIVKDHLEYMKNRKGE